MLENLTGRWKVIACQLHGTWLPDSIFREFRYNLTAEGAFVIQWAELSYPAFLGGFPKSKTGKVSVDPSAFTAQHGQVYEIWLRVG